MKCLHCGGEGQELPPANAVGRFWCRECGSLFFGGAEVAYEVPLRSRPAVPVERLNASHRVWSNELGQIAVVGQTTYRLFDHNGGGGSKFDLADCKFTKQWVPWTPPIVANPPEPTAAEDAAWLRELLATSVLCKREDSERVLRIAARIEAAGKEGE